MAAINNGCVAQQMERKQLLCRFHIRGSCRDGEYCAFSHDTHTSVPIPETVCWYYLQSDCMYGENCRFVHMDAASILTSHELASQLMALPVTQSVPQSVPQSVTQSVPQSAPQTAPQSQPVAQQSSPVSQLPHNNISNSSNSNVVSSRAQLVPFNKFSSSSQKPLTPIQPNTTTCLSPTNTSLITESRQSSEDSGFNEPSSSSRSSTVKTYAQVMANSDGKDKIVPLVVYNRDVPLCEFAINSPDGVCPYSDGQCHYLHGDICDYCGRACLHPYDIEQQNKHRDECIKEHEREMEISFAIQRSIDKACGICMDIIFEKEPITERRFGILEKCSHIFCLSCIRKWRQTKQFDNRTIRACPECRVPSDFVVPSKYWYDEKSEKQQLIDSYKKALSTKPCKYFKQGQGECPFAGACFYLHAYPDGRKAEMPPPRARRRQNHDGELETLRDMLLWNYLEVRDDNHWLLTLDLEDVFDIHEMGLLSGYETDDESDLSDYADNLIG